MASHVGLLATQGLRHVQMNVRPNIAILTTGNELLAADQVPTHAGQIYDSNGLMLQALVQQHGLAASVTLAHAADDLPTLVGTMETLLAAADVLICVGGMSVGEHDYVKPALAQIGVETDFWRVAMKPGKPFLFGHHGGKAIFGLPGNPVSAYVTAFLLVLPALRKMCGAREPAPLAISATLAASVSNRDQRPHYVRGCWEASGTFTPLGLQESYALHGLCLANALLPVEPGAALSAGQAVWILPLGAGAGQKS